MLTVVPRACVRILGVLFRRADSRLARGAARNVATHVASRDTGRLDVGFTLRDLRGLRTASLDAQWDAIDPVGGGERVGSGDVHAW
jgi:hypothetical protein